MQTRLRHTGLKRLRDRYAALPARVGPELRKGIASSLRVLQQEIQARTPSRSSHLRGSIQPRLTGGGRNLGGVVESDAPHAVPVEYGTGIFNSRRGASKEPILIRAKRAKALRFHYGGRLLFRRSVVIRGMHGKHMFRDGTQAARGKVGRILAGHLGNLTRHA
jgi:hypothetical protein